VRPVVATGTLRRIVSRRSRFDDSAAFRDCGLEDVFQAGVAHYLVGGAERGPASTAGRCWAPAGYPDRRRTRCDPVSRRTDLARRTSAAGSSCLPLSCTASPIELAKFTQSRNYCGYGSLQLPCDQRLVQAGLDHRRQLAIVVGRPRWSCGAGTDHFSPSDGRKVGWASALAARRLAWARPEPYREADQSDRRQHQPYESVVAQNRVLQLLTRWRARSHVL
jgi:hypothetical protein